MSVRTNYKPDYPLTIIDTDSLSGSFSTVTGLLVALYRPDTAHYYDPNNASSWEHAYLAQDNGNGDYVFTGAGGSPQDGNYRVYIGTTTGNMTYQAQLGVIFIPTQDLTGYVYSTADDQTLSGNYTMTGNLTVTGATTLTQPLVDTTSTQYTTNVIASPGLVHRAYADAKYASTGSVSSLTQNLSGSLSGYFGALHQGNEWTGTQQWDANLTANCGQINLVATVVEAEGATGNWKHLSSSSVTAQANASQYGFGLVMLGAGFTDTGGDYVPIISAGFDSGEAPYVNFHNVSLQNLNIPDLPNPVGVKQRLVDVNWTTTQSGYTYKTIQSAINSCSNPTSDNTYDVIIKNAGGSISGSSANFASVSYVNMIGEGNTKIILQSTSYGNTLVYKNLKMRKSDTSVSFTNPTLEDCELYVKSDGGGGALSASFSKVHLKNCYVVVDEDGSAAIEFSGGNNVIDNCRFSKQPVTAAGDIYLSNNVVNTSLSGLDWL